MHTGYMEKCDKHGTDMNQGVCDLCVLESLSRQNREYVRRYFPERVVAPPVEFRTIQEIMNA